MPGVDERERVEAYVRELVERQGLPMPDDFEARERSVVLKWTERRVAVIVDFDEAARAHPAPATVAGLAL
jgi:hypothetical protein